MSAEQLAKRCQTKTQMTEKLLIAATAMGLLKKKGNLFSIPPFRKISCARQKTLSG